MASPSQITGIGAIEANGLVSDVNLILSSLSSLRQTVQFSNASGDVTSIDLDLSSDPDSNGALGAGWLGSGALTISNGLTIKSSDGYIGRHAGSSGAVQVTGHGTSWAVRTRLIINNGSLNVRDGATVSARRGSIGDNGSLTVDGTTSTCVIESPLSLDGEGELNIRGGGSVIAVGPTSIGSGGGNGAIHFGAGGGTFSSASLEASPNQITGTGNIMVNGLVSDNDLTFDSNASLKQTLVFDKLPGQNVAVLLDMSSNPNTNGWLGAGWNGKGSLTIKNGANVSSLNGTIGCNAGASGVVTVAGAGSTWTLRSKVIGSSSYGGGELNVGNHGNGVLAVIGGGSVTNDQTNIGYYSDAQGEMIIDVGTGSKLTANSTITNNGVVQIVAGAAPLAGTKYKPISAGTWSGTGTYQGIGGTWNASAHEFTVSQLEAAVSGSPINIDLQNKQRILVDDSSTGWSLGASFLGSTASKPLAFTGTVITGETLASLQCVLGPNDFVLSAWDCTVTGYTAGDSAYLSLNMADGYTPDDLSVWHYNGTAWSEYGARDLTVTGPWASFVVSGFSGYALTATNPIPEPSSLALLAVPTGLIGAWLIRRRL